MDALAAGLLSLASFMTVTPFTIGDVSAIGANWLGGANIISGIIIGLVVAEIFTLLSVRIGLSDYLTAYGIGFALIYCINPRFYYSFHDGTDCMGAVVGWHPFSSGDYEFDCDATGGRSVASLDGHM
ncbi:PTS system, cellobiose-specific IIC component [Salmonella enterica subsp. arizonae]|uniref:PTS system, cellobiose-specific IIC component n=1 Tax=Salmonella enterica subsp. arizonae TaxID=59203 RepID=A0A379S9G7_SALER|nr:PTS system, cellobiose-specific IIC component [Salmonella enterica subsp. arizonae]